MIFDDLYTLSSIPEDTIKTYLTIMFAKDDGATDVAIITPTKADAMRQLNELDENFLSGKVDSKNMTLAAPNGTTIHFIPMAEALQRIKGKRFKAIHFRR